MNRLPLVIAALPQSLFLRPLDRPAPVSELVPSEKHRKIGPVAFHFALYEIGGMVIL